MAAILCNGIGDCMRYVCLGLEQVFCFPCRLCGCVCENLCDVITTPFFFFLAVALGFNIPPIVFAFQEHASWLAAGGGGLHDSDCGRGLFWLLIDAALCAANIFAALYVVAAIQRSRRYQSESLIKDTRENSLKRVTHVLCYDPCFALYLVVFIVFLIWQSMGISKVVAMRDDGGCGTLRGHIIGALICGHCFLSLTATAFICSMCCMKVQNGLPR